MTVPYPLDAFDQSLPLRKPARPSLNREKLVSAGITIAFHVAVVIGLLAMVHVAPTRIMSVMTVHIEEQKQKPADEIAPPPTLVKPTEVTVAMPDVVVANPVSPIAAQPRQTVAPPPTAPVATAPQKQSGEGRESFQARLLAQLNRYKQYPAMARKAHVTGVVMLHFVMDAEGKVTVFEIAKSSGRPLLDAEALALIQRAQPLPALPADFPSRTLDAVVPIEFSLND